MVCLGNICRSPIAEGILQHKAKQNGLDWTVHSAGTNGYHIGEAPHRFSQKVCKQHGIDISRQRATCFLSRHIEEYDLIYALAEDVYEEIKKIGGPNAPMHKVKMFLSELHEGSTASVPDPWYGDESGYLPVYQIIDQTCDAIVAKALKS